MEDRKDILKNIGTVLTALTVLSIFVKTGLACIAYARITDSLFLTICGCLYFVFLSWAVMFCIIYLYSDNN